MKNLLLITLAFLFFACDDEGADSVHDMFYKESECRLEQKMLNEISFLEYEYDEKGHFEYFSNYGIAENDTVIYQDESYFVDGNILTSQKGGRESIYVKKGDSIICDNYYLSSRGLMCKLIYISKDELLKRREIWYDGDLIEYIEAIELEDRLTLRHYILVNGEFQLLKTYTYKGFDNKKSPKVSPYPVYINSNPLEYFVTEYYGSNTKGQITFWCKYSYEYNSKGYPKVQFVEDKLNNSDRETKYFYNCDQK